MLYVCVCVYTYIYIYTHIHTHTYICIYMYAIVYHIMLWYSVCVYIYIYCIPDTVIWYVRIWFMIYYNLLHYTRSYHTIPHHTTLPRAAGGGRPPGKPGPGRWWGLSAQPLPFDFADWEKVQGSSSVSTPGEGSRSVSITSQSESFETCCRLGCFVSGSPQPTRSGAFH